MSKSVLFVGVLVGVGLIALFMFSGCITQNTFNTTNKTNITNETNIPNPASVYCINQGINSTIVTNPDGSQYGMCGICEEWAFYRGECTQTPIKVCLSDLSNCPDGSLVRRNISLNCEFNPCPSSKVCYKCDGSAVHFPSGTECPDYHCASDSETYAYQENATAYTFTGGWSNSNVAIDGDWTNWNQCNGACSLYLNYTKVSDTALWQIKSGATPYQSFFNVTIPAQCFANNIQLKMDWQQGAMWKSFYCYDVSQGTWSLMTKDLVASGSRFVEEAIWWKQ